MGFLMTAGGSQWLKRRIGDRVRISYLYWCWWINVFLQSGNSQWITAPEVCCDSWLEGFGGEARGETIEDVFGEVALDAIGMVGEKWELFGEFDITEVFEEFKLAEGESEELSKGVRRAARHRSCSVSNWYGESWKDFCKELSRIV